MNDDKDTGKLSRRQARPSKLIRAGALIHDPRRPPTRPLPMDAL